MAFATTHPSESPRCVCPEVKHFGRAKSSPWSGPDCRDRLQATDEYVAAMKASSKIRPERNRLIGAVCTPSVARMPSYHRAQRKGAVSFLCVRGSAGIHG